MATEKRELMEATVQEYTVTQTTEGRLVVLRYGKEWKDYTGENCVLALLTEIVSLKEQLAEQELFLSALSDDVSGRKVQEAERGAILKYLAGYVTAVKGSVPIVGVAIHEIIDYIEKRGQHEYIALEKAKDERLEYEQTLQQIVRITIHEPTRVLARIALGDKLRKSWEPLENLINPVEDGNEEKEQEEKLVGGLPEYNQTNDIG